MRYYIADLHFCHENLNTRMDCRGFESGETMNEYMIAQWNSRVRKRDEVVILGDFCISKKGRDHSKCRNLRSCKCHSRTVEWKEVSDHRKS